MWTLFEDENVDAIMVIDGVGMVGGLTGLMNILPAVKDRCERHLDASRAEEIADIERMMDLMKKYQKPVILANMVRPPIRDTEVARKLLQDYMGPYPTLERAAKALAHLVEYSEYLGIARK
jgi:hypothetical protein